MSTRDEAIEAIQQGIKEIQKTVDFGEAIERLIQNKDFQTVIDVGYFTNEARRLTLLSADPEITEQGRAYVMRSLQAIGELHSFLQIKRIQADQAAKDIEYNKRSLDELMIYDEDETEGSDAE